MTGAWMIYANVLASFAYVAALVAEHVMWVWRAPRRVPWLVAIGISVTGPLVVPMMRGPLEPARVGTRAGVVADHRLTSLVDQRDANPESVRTDLVAGTSALSPSRAPTSLEPLLIRGWIASSSVAFLFLLITCARFRRQRSAWPEIELDGIRVLLAPQQGPAVVGVRHPRIVVPEWSLSLNGSARSIMLRHEREHLAARDPQCLFLTAVAVALMPWNVPLWLMMRALRRAIELDCDHRVLGVDSDIDRYGSLLLEFAAHRVRPLGLAAGLVESQSLLERRIRVMTAIRPRRPLLVTMPLVLSIAMVTLGAMRTRVPQSPFAGIRASVSANPRLVRSEPRINADWENAPIQFVIAAFESFSHRRITASPEVSGFVSAHIVDQPWTTALKTIMSSNGFEVTFNADSSITISVAKPARNSAPSQRRERRTSSREISGTVTDAETGRGISGAYINVIGTQAIGEPNEAWTNDHGQFSLRGPDREVWLDACAAGYEFTRVTLAPTDSIANFHGHRTSTFGRDTALYRSIVGTPRFMIAGIPIQPPPYVVVGRPVGATTSRRQSCGRP